MFSSRTAHPPADPPSSPSRFDDSRPPPPPSSSPKSDDFILPTAPVILSLGPMFAGKSTATYASINRALRGRRGHKAVLALPPELKEEAHRRRRSRDGVLAPVDTFLFESQTDSEFMRFYDFCLQGRYTIVCFDDVQFFGADTRPSFRTIFDHLTMCGITVYLTGLTGDMNQQKMGVVPELIPIVDDIHYVKADCSFCGRLDCALYSVYVGRTPVQDRAESSSVSSSGGRSSTVLVSQSQDDYKAACRSCMCYREYGHRKVYDVLLGHRQSIRQPVRVDDIQSIRLAGGGDDDRSRRAGGPQAGRR